MGAKWASHTLLSQLGATVEESPWHLKIPWPRQGHNPSQSSARRSLHSDSALSQNLLFPTCPWRTILAPSAAFCRASASSSVLYKQSQYPNYFCFYLFSQRKYPKTKHKEWLRSATHCSTFMMPITHSFLCKPLKFQSSKTSINVIKCFYKQ